MDEAPKYSESSIMHICIFLFSVQRQERKPEPDCNCPQLGLVLSKRFHQNQDKYSEVYNKVNSPLAMWECHQRVSTQPATRHRRRSGTRCDGSGVGFCAPEWSRKIWHYFITLSWIIHPLVMWQDIRDGLGPGLIAGCDGSGVGFCALERKKWHYLVFDNSPIPPLDIGDGLGLGTRCDGSGVAQTRSLPHNQSNATAAVLRSLKTLPASPKRSDAVLKIFHQYCYHLR